MEVVDIELEFKEVEIDQLLLHLLSRVKDLTSFQLTHAPLLNAFYLAKIEELLILFFVADSSDNERALCHIIVVSDDVICLPALPLPHLLQWLDPLSELLHRYASITEGSDVFELRLVGLLRDLAAVDYTGIRPDVDFFDDQFIALHEHFQVGALTSYFRIFSPDTTVGGEEGRGSAKHRLSAASDIRDAG